MKKAFKIYGWAWVALITAVVLTIVVMSIVPSHHDLAEDPDCLEKIIKVDLPDIVSTDSEDNLYRGASRWDTYTHLSRFSEELSDECIKELDNLCMTDSLHWQKNVAAGYYLYSDEGGIDGLYFIECYIYKDHSYLEYSVDELEGLFVFIFFILLYHVFVIWGVVLVVIAVIRKIKNRKKKQL